MSDIDIDKLIESLKHDEQAVSALNKAYEEDQMYKRFKAAEAEYRKMVDNLDVLPAGAPRRMAHLLLVMRRNNVLDRNLAILPLYDEIADLLQSMQNARPLPFVTSDQSPQAAYVQQGRGHTPFRLFI